MHRITVTHGARLLVGSQVVVPDDPFTDPRLRLYLRTDLEDGVILDLDPAALRFLSSTLRTMLDTYRDAVRSLRRTAPPFSSRPTPRPLSLRF